MGVFNLYVKRFKLASLYVRKYWSTLPVPSQGFSRQSVWVVALWGGVSLGTPCLPWWDVEIYCCLMLSLLSKSSSLWGSSGSYLRPLNHLGGKGMLPHAAWALSLILEPDINGLAGLLWHVFRTFTPNAFGVIYRHLPPQVLVVHPGEYDLGQRTANPWGSWLSRNGPQGIYTLTSWLRHWAHSVSRTDVARHRMKDYLSSNGHWWSSQTSFWHSLELLSPFFLSQEYTFVVYQSASLLMCSRGQ